MLNKTLKWIHIDVSAWLHVSQRKPGMMTDDDAKKVKGTCIKIEWLINHV